MNHYLEAFRKVRQFNGRASRAEYWQFQLVFILGYIALAITGKLIHHHFFVSLYIVASMIPAISLSFRRVQDTGKSGWFALVPVYGFILLCTRGTQGPNSFGSQRDFTGEIGSLLSESHPAA